MATPLQGRRGGPQLRVPRARLPPLPLRAGPARDDVPASIPGAVRGRAPARGEWGFPS